MLDPNAKYQPSFDFEELFNQPITLDVWHEKYRFKSLDGTPREASPYETHERVVSGIYEHDSVEEAQKALTEMKNWRWCPAGRQHAGAGTGLDVTLYNCYTSPKIEDSMRTQVGENSAGIMDTLSVAALTQQMGGGIGMDFSPIRPKGALVKRRLAPASGPLKFMDMWDSMCRTIMSSGSRRGAMMATLRCDHPDILDFIEAKHDPNRLRMFNVSVLVTDAFMKAVNNNEDWELGFHEPRMDGQHEGVYGDPWYVYQRLNARDLWNKIIQSTYDHAEPGVIFIDQVNKKNNLYYCEEIYTTNPCGEQPLPPNANCCLGAVNLAAMVKHPFSSAAEIDYKALRQTVEVGVRWLDNVINVSKHPTEAQTAEGERKRRIGLGITGLGNMLQEMQIRYGSDESIEITRQVMRFIRDEAYRASVKLAKERGPFPAFDKDKYLKAAFVKKLPKDIKDDIAEHGIRNGVLLTIAPTGTTSVYYGNISSGIEPTFSRSYTRKVLDADGNLKEYGEVEDFGYRLYRLLGYDTNNLPDYMVSAMDLPVGEHLKMQAVCQEFIDASVSKTINVPQDYDFEDFKAVYEQAYQMGCKGCTTYRPNPASGRGSVLSTSDSKPVAKADEVTVEPRPEELVGYTYKVRWPSVDQAFYITINDLKDEQTGEIRPFEMFINSKSVYHQEWMTALTRTISAVFRRGGDVSFLVEELKQVHSAQGGFWHKGEYIPSLVALIGNELEKHLAKHKTIELEESSPPVVQNKQFHGEMCPKCSTPAMVKKEGCSMCMNCTHSQCG